MQTEPAKRIDITIQEEDRQKAEPYTDGRGCLVNTALKRMGHKNVHCYLYSHVIDGFTYVSLQTGSDNLHAITMFERRMRPWPEQGPYYHPEVVGKQITLTLQD